MNVHEYEDLLNCSTEELYEYVASIKKYLPPLRRAVDEFALSASKAADRRDFEAESDQRQEAARLNREIVYYEQQIAWSNNIVKRRAKKDQLVLPGFFYDDDVPF